MPADRKYVIFAMISLSLLMASIDSTIVAVGLPSMLSDLHTDLSWLGWIITGYMLMSTIVMPLMGRICDDFGRKRLFLAATVVFTSASFLCGFAPSVQWLIFFRVIQAIGGGTFMPAGVAIVSEHFKENRARMIGLFSSIMPIGGILGPNLGGWLVQNLSWRYIFYVNVPLGIIVTVCGFILLHDAPMDRKGSIIDFKGAGLLTGTILSFMYALTRLGESAARLGDAIVWLSLLAGCVFLLVFVRTELRIADPILDIALLRWRPFAATNVLNFFFGACTFSVFSMVPTYAVMAYGMSAMQSGVLLTPRSLGSMTLAFVASMLIARTGYHMPLIVGNFIIAFSSFLLSQGFHNAAIFGWPVTDFAVLSAIVAVNGVGLGLTMPAANNAALELMPNRIGAITGLRGMFRQMGGVMGTSATVLVMALYGDPVKGLQAVFVGVAVVMVLITPLVLAIPRSAGAVLRPLPNDESATLAEPRAIPPRFQGEG